MADRTFRNPVSTAFARGEKQRHQVHKDKRRLRRVKLKPNHVEQED